MTTAFARSVGNLMTIDPITVEPGTPAHEAEALLKTYRISGLPVVEEDHLIGVLSQTDLLAARSSELISGNWPRLRVRHLMSHPPITVRTDSSVTDAAARMIEEHVHRLVVVDDDGRPIGVVTPLDLLRVVLEDCDAG